MVCTNLCYAVPKCQYTWYLKSESSDSRVTLGCLLLWFIDDWLEYSRKLETVARNDDAVLTRPVKKGKGVYSCLRKSISQLRSVTCHMGSHSVTCHPTQVSTPCLNPSHTDGTWFTYPGGMEGWVDLGGLLHTEMVYPPQMVIHPSTNRAWCRLTSSIDQRR